MKRVTFLIEEELHHRLRKTATQQHKTMSEVMRELIEFEVLKSESRHDDPLFRNVPKDRAQWKGGKRDSTKGGDAFRG